MAPEAAAPIRDLAKPKGIQDVPSVVLFMEATPAEQQDKLLQELEPLAAKYRDAAWEKQDDPEILFFAAKSSAGPAPQIRSMTKQEALPPAKHEHEVAESDQNSGWGCDGCGKGGSGKRFRCTKGCDFDFCEDCQKASGKTVAPVPPKAILLNLDENGAFYELEGEVTAAAVEKFLADFNASTLPRKQCSSA